MAFLGIQVPHPTARILTSLDVPGKKVDVSTVHITLLYLGKGILIDDLTEAIKVIYSVSRGTRPFSVRTSLITSFPRNPDDGIPIIARIESDALHNLRSKLTNTFDEAGIEYDKKYPIYKPHTTISYSEEEFEEMRIQTVEWGAHELVLWSDSKGDGKLTVTFPLALSNTVTANAVTDRFVQTRLGLNV